MMRGDYIHDGVVNHQISVDEADSAQSEDIAYKAFCTCGWCAETWRHSDMYDFDNIDEDGCPALPVIDCAQAAFDAASADGDDHLQEVQS